jgi:hypothetical protein
LAREKEKRREADGKKIIEKSIANNPHWLYESLFIVGVYSNYY